MHYTDSHIDDEHKAHFKTLHKIRLPKSQWSLTAMVVLGLLACGLFVYLVPWVQTASGTGQVIALNPQDRVQNVTAFVSGRIEKWYVTDGQLVKKGDPIVQLADNDPNLLERLAAEKSQVQAQISAAQSAMAIAQLDVNRSETLFREGLGSRRDFEQSRIRVAEMQARLSEARASLNQIEVNLSRQSVQTVTAPRDGVIQRISGGAEATLVSQGQVVATFAPTEAKRVVEVYIDGRDVALIKPGNPVKPRTRLKAHHAIAVRAAAPAVQAVQGLIKHDTLRSAPFRITYGRHSARSCAAHRKIACPCQYGQQCAAACNRSARHL